jgi:antitoxin FitA
VGLLEHIPAEATSTRGFGLTALIALPSLIAMASVTIRNLEPELKLQLRVRAASRGRSMEEEVRVILREAVAREAEPPADVASAIRALFRPLGGVDLRIPARDPMREPPKFR